MSSKLEWYQFCAKYIAVIGSAIWVLIAGTDLILKESSAIDLRNKKLGIESIPLAKPYLDYNFENDPWIGNEELCTVTGQYKIENIGSLPIIITKVTFDVYENKTLTPSDIGDKGIKSFTLNATINRLKPILSEPIAESSKIDVGQYMERSFGYVIKKKRGYVYSIDANAEGGLANTNGGVDSKYVFGKNELRFNSGFKFICGGDASLP